MHRSFYCFVFEMSICSSLNSRCSTWSLATPPPLQPYGKFLYYLTYHGNNLISPNCPGWGLLADFRKKCGEKNHFSLRISYIFLRWTRWIAENYLFSPRSQYSYKKESSPHGFEPLIYCVPSNAKSTAPTVTVIFGISCEFKSDWVNFGYPMRWIFVRNAVKCGKIFFFTAFTAFTAFLTLIGHKCRCGELL